MHESILELQKCVESKSSPISIQKFAHHNSNSIQFQTILTYIPTTITKNDSTLIIYCHNKMLLCEINIMLKW